MAILTTNTREHTHAQTNKKNSTLQKKNKQKKFKKKHMDTSQYTPDKTMCVDRILHMYQQIDIVHSYLNKLHYLYCY